MSLHRPVLALASKQQTCLRASRSSFTSANRRACLYNSVGFSRSARYASGTTIDADVDGSSGEPTEPSKRSSAGEVEQLSVPRDSDYLARCVGRGDVKVWSDLVENALNTLEDVYISSPNNDQYSFTALIPGELSENVKSTFVKQIPAMGKHATQEVGVVLVCTKLLRPWIEDDSFLRDTLLGLFNRTSSTLSLRVRLFVAVVDSVGEQGDQRLSEGISCFTGPASSMFPGSSEPAKPSRETASQRGVLNFQFRDRPPISETFASVQVPAANTLFDNGRPHTMFSVSCEIFADNKVVFSPKLYENQKDIVVSDLSSGVEMLTDRSPSHVHGPKRLTYLKMTLPLTSIAPVRMVKEVSGNIVRKLVHTTIGSQVYTASEELEAGIEKYFVKNEIEPQAVNIWALIIPNSVAGSGSPRSKQDLRLLDNNGPERVVAIYRLLMQGAKLRKVLSGGGGWGARAGLLSLDPSSHYQDSESEGLGMPSWLAPKLLQEDNASPYDGSRIIDSSVATPGDYIKYFILHTHDKKAARVADVNNMPADVDPESFFKYKVVNMRFGTLSEEGHVTPSQEERAHVSEPAKLVHWRSRSFEANSTEGIALTLQDEKTGRLITSSKIDAPFASFRVARSFYPYDLARDVRLKRSIASLRYLFPHESRKP